MKTLLALFLLGISSLASAEMCTAVIRDPSGYVFETFTRSSYSQQAACDTATFDCRNALMYGQSMGRYLNATCTLQFERPDPRPYPLLCQTDLVDRFGGTVRAFTANGRDEREACFASDNMCKSELARRDSFGHRCVNRGIVNGRRPRTEQCTANRFDPAGMFIQSYTSVATGPADSDVLGMACRNAVNECSRDLRGRQTCVIGR